MRSPAERRLAYQVELARGRRLAAGIPADETWSKRLRQRWPMRLMCSMECGPGWADLVEALNELIDVEATGEFRFTQIKEKFGQLRAYWHGVDEHGRIEELVEAAEEVSASMCETCSGDAKVWQTQGGPGFGYVHVACDEHARPGSAIVRVKTEKIRTPIGNFRANKVEDDT
ncbi:MAG: hypothetical protein K2Z25_19240 [Beijerinckiaceae bacterium]|nr:hypothetical protein [Beijerinckiaceae bacterium]